MEDIKYFPLNKQLYYTHFFSTVASVLIAAVGVKISDLF